MDGRPVMIGALLLPLGSAWACPDVDASLASAASDALDYFLADARAGLDAAVAGWACGSVATPAQLGRYWATSGVVLRLQGAEGVERAFAAGRAADASAWNEDFGAEPKALWESAVVLAAAPVPFGIRGGLGPDEQVWLDGTAREGDLAATPGFHVLQVGRPGAMRFAKILDVPDGGAPFTVDPPDGARLPAPAGPVPTPDPVAPAPDGTGPSDVPQRWVPPLIANGRIAQDSRGVELSWRDAVVPLAMRDPVGARAVGRSRRAPVAQLGGLAVAGVGGYVGYLFLWDVTTGHSKPPALSGGVAAGSLVVSAGALGLVARSVLRGPKRRRAVLEGAERALAASGSP